MKTLAFLDLRIYPGCAAAPPQRASAPEKRAFPPAGGPPARRPGPFPFAASVHKDISERLPQFNRALYLQVKEVLDVNKAQRHIRGGIATRKKYRGT